jgi:pimeloyl-ACP methyl ester carboxylesterase
MVATTLAGADGLRLASDWHRGHRQTPVLLLHGGGQTRHAWGTAASELAADGWPTAAVDLRGHGDSDWSSRQDYRIDAFAADVASIVRSYDRPPVLVGASLGGLSSLLAVSGSPPTPPARASGLVLVDVAHRFERGGAQRIVDFMASGRDGFEDPSQAAEAIAAYLPHRPPPTDSSGVVKNLRRRDGRWRWHWDPVLLESSRPLLDGEGATALQSRLEAVIAGLTIPLMLVRGGLSDVITPEIAAEFAALAPAAEVVEVSGAAHMVAGDSNDPFARAVIDFLQRHFGGPRRRRA